MNLVQCTYLIVVKESLRKQVSIKTALYINTIHCLYMNTNPSSTIYSTLQNAQMIWLSLPL